MPSSHLILCLLLLLPPIPPSIRVFSNESTLHMRWPKYWSFSFSFIPSKEISGLIFRMNWLDLLAAQGTLKSLLQHHNSKTSIPRCFSFHNSPCHCVSPKLPIKDLLMPEKGQQVAVQTAVPNLAAHQSHPGVFERLWSHKCTPTS